jgi:hypothetical protein
MNTLMHVLVAVHKISPPEHWERIRVQVRILIRTISIFESLQVCSHEILAAVFSAAHVDVSDYMF